MYELNCRNLDGDNDDDEEDEEYDELMNSIAVVVGIIFNHDPIQMEKRGEKFLKKRPK